MSAVLLDASVLIPLASVEHEHYERCSRWLVTQEVPVLCPITEGALLRYLVRLGTPVVSARAVVTGFREAPGWEFWPDAVSYTDIDLSWVRGHRQLTDAYLLALARRNGGRLATLDAALATVAGEIAVLPPEVE